MRPVSRADEITVCMCRLYRNSGSLNLLEPSGPLHACSGMLYYCIKEMKVKTWHRATQRFRNGVGKR